jgi:glycosidase
VSFYYSKFKNLLPPQLGWSLLWLIFGGTIFAQTAPNTAWQAQSIYQIFTDRFFDGDAANNNASGSYNASSGTGVHGGDFKGIEQKLDYIKALGATAIWISPIVKNGNGEYHGYSGIDFYSVDPHWGTLSNLQVMVNAAHALGISVIQDVVINHGSTLNNINGNTAFNASGYPLSYANAAKKYAAPFNTNSVNPSLTNIFHNYGAIQDYNNVTQVELGELSGLDDFRTESAYVRTNMAAIYNFWITNAGFDGFRIDTVKHAEMGFWQDWCPRIHDFAAANGKTNFFLFGEVFDGSDAKNGSYSGTNGGGAFKLDSLLDYPLFFAMQSVFEWGGNTKQIEDHYNALAANYDTSTINQLVTFLDNHDTTRFLNSANANGDTNRLNVALAFLHTSRGIPCVYQGTEQAFNGGADPNNREDMFAGAFEQGPSLGDNFNQTHPQFQLIAKLNNFRRLYPALSLGTHVNQWNNPTSAGLFAYARRYGAQEIFVVLNTAAATQTLPSRTTIYPAGTVLVNLLDPNETLTLTNALLTPPIVVPSLTAKIFIAQAQVLPLDPVVTNNYPAHGSTNIPTWAGVMLQFSQPMDTNSVQSAFGTSASLGGTFSWSVTRDAMTFTPSGAGWPALSNLVVRVTNSAFATSSSNALRATYELKFKTAAFSVNDTNRPTLTLVTPTNGAVISGIFSLAGTAADNLAVAKVEWQLDNGAWQTATGTNAWNASLNSSNFLNGPHLLAARATDSVGNFSATNSVNVTFFNLPGDYVQRISGGNPSNVTNCDTQLWLTDRAYSFGGSGYVGGAAGYVANTVSGICTAAQPLYRREHFSTASGGFYYQFDCPSGLYETTLLEAETYWSATNQRVFNIFIQGQQVVTNLDIFAKVGGQNLPLTLVFTNAVTNSQLQIQFTPVVDNARVSGVQVRKIADVFSDSDGIPDWWRLGYFGRALGASSDNSRGTDDADGDGVSNLTEYLHRTSPQNAGMFPVLPPFNLGGVVMLGSNFQLDCQSTTNWTYQLQRCDSLANSAVWTEVASAVTGTGGKLVFSDSASNTTRFYRLQAR